MTATLAQIEAAVLGTLGEIYKPASTQPPVAWCEENLVITPAENKRLAGRFDTSHAPCGRPIIDFIAKRPPYDQYDELWIPKSSQTGVSFNVLAGLAWKARNRPGNVIYGINNQDDAGKMSTRFRLLIENMRGAAERPLFDPARDQSVLTMHLNAMDLHFVGGSAGGYAGKPNIEVGVLDETEITRGTKGESSIVKLLRDRFKNSAEKAIIGLCKPLTFEGLIWQEYLTGSRHKLFVPCPHCDFFQELVFENLDFSHCRDLTGDFDLLRVQQETVFKCVNPACQKPIEEKWKRQMVLAGEYRATNFGQDEKYRPEPRKMSLHLSDFYSQFPGAAWGEIAKEWILAQGDGAAMQAVFNSRFALPKKEQASETEESDIQILAGPGFGQPAYLENTLPVLPALLKADNAKGAIFKLADNQEGYRQSVTVAFDADENLYVLTGETTLSFTELLHCPPILCRRPDGSDQSFEVFAGAIDSGYRPDDVRDFCFQSRGFFTPTMGRPSEQVRDIAEKSENTHNGRRFITYRYNDSIFTPKLYLDRLGQSVRQRKAELNAKTAEERLAAFKTPYPFIRFFKDPEEEFCAGFCKAHRVLDRKRGKPVWRWKEDKGNENGDCVKIALVIWYFMRPFFQLNEKKFGPRSTEIKTS